MTTKEQEISKVMTEFIRLYVEYTDSGVYVAMTCDTDQPDLDDFLKASLERLYEKGYEDGRKEAYEPCGICHSTECRGIHNY